MKVLLVGAGAVGQVYAHFFQRGGAEVAFLVKPAHLERSRWGFTLYPVKDGKVRLEAEAMTDTGGRAFDAVVLCTSSPALRGDWLEALAAETGNATVAMLQPGLTDRAYVERRVGAERLVGGMIGFLAWEAPLPGEPRVEPGTAYWFPPLTVCPLSGSPARVAPLVDVLRRGGFPARVHPDAPAEIALKAAIVETTVAALECAGWTFARLRRDRELLGLAARAAREATALAERCWGSARRSGPG